MRPQLHITSDQARLLPRCRDGFDEIAIRTRDHADVLRAAIPDHDTRPLRHALTKPGDPAALRGIPAIGRSVAGEIPNSNPLKETMHRAAQSERMRLRIDIDDGPWLVSA